MKLGKICIVLGLISLCPDTELLQLFASEINGLERFYVQLSTRTSLLRENKIALKMGCDSLGESNLNPLRSLFQLLNIQPLQEAMCTGVDLENRKRPFTPKARMEEYESNLAKRRKAPPFKL